MCRLFKSFYSSGHFCIFELGTNSRQHEIIRFVFTGYDFFFFFFPIISVLVLCSQGGDKALIIHLYLLLSSFPVLPPDLKEVTTACQKSASELQKSDFESKCLISTLKSKPVFSIKNVLYCDMSGKKKLTEVHCKRRQKKEETFSLVTLRKWIRSGTETTDTSITQ